MTVAVSGFDQFIDSIFIWRIFRSKIAFYRPGYRAPLVSEIA